MDQRCLERPLAGRGGSQALDRTELVPVVFGDRSGLVPRPSLLGAIVGKAVAVGVDHVPDAQRLDLALLLSLVDAPIVMAAELTRKDGTSVDPDLIARILASLAYGVLAEYLDSPRDERAALRTTLIASLRNSSSAASPSRVVSPPRPLSDQAALLAS